jgi:hypothetical protein
MALEYFFIFLTRQNKKEKKGLGLGIKNDGGIEPLGVCTPAVLVVQKNCSFVISKDNLKDGFRPRGNNMRRPTNTGSTGCGKSKCNKVVLSGTLVRSASVLISVQKHMDIFIKK